MKKILFLIFIFLFNLGIVNAKEDIIIKNLEITNGVLSPSFDKYNNYYSVEIEEGTSALECNVTYNSEDYELTVLNNEKLEENKLIYMTVVDKDTNEQNTYILKTYITEDLETFDEENNNQSLEIKKTDDTNYAPMVGTICFLLIIFVYYVIFLK